MSKAWSSSIPSGPKLVLLSLCDFANDAGECFPSVDLMTKRCSMDDRTVRRHLAYLVDRGYLLRAERRGRSTLFTVTPPISDTPPISVRGTPPISVMVPLPFLSATPPLFAPHNHQEPSNNQIPIPNTRAQGGDRRSTIAASIFQVNDVDPDVWQDFVTLRKAKHAPLTKTAVDGLRREAEKAGWSLEDVVRECCGRGWVGFKAAWVQTGARPGASAAQSFKAQDDEAARARWEAMTGQTHPDNVPRLALVGNVIDASSQFARIAL